jgi:DNA-binding XRE family transcriptional regulator
MRPFCRLLFKAIRYDSPPFSQNSQELAKALIGGRLQARQSQEKLAAKLGVSYKTLKNWERGRTRPTAKFWPRIRALLEPVRA